MICSNLSRLVDQGAGLSIGQENTVNELIKIKEELTADNQTKDAQLLEANQKIQELEAANAQYQTEKLQSESEISSLKNILATKKAEQERDSRRKERYA